MTARELKRINTDLNRLTDDLAEMESAQRYWRDNLLRTWKASTGATRLTISQVLPMAVYNFGVSEISMLRYLAEQSARATGGRKERD